MSALRHPLDIGARPLVAGLPNGTYFDSASVADRDAYQYWLATPAYGVTTVAELTSTDAYRHACPRNFAAMLQRRLEDLRLHHYFACTHSRGGYC